MQKPRRNLLHLWTPLISRTTLTLFVLFSAWAHFGALMDVSTMDNTVTIPYLLGRGLHLYDQVYLFHSPVQAWLLAALYQLNPDALLNIRLLNVASILLTGALVWYCARRVWGQLAGVSSVVFFWVWSISYNGLFFYIDGLVGTLSIAVAALATHRLTPVRLLCIGLLIGFAAALKQNMIVLLGAIALWGVFAWRAKQIRLGVLVIPLITALATFALPYLFLIVSNQWETAQFALYNPGNTRWLTAWSELFNGTAWRNLALSLLLVPGFLFLWWEDGKTRLYGILLLLLCGGTALLNIPAPGYYHMMGCLPIIAVMSGAAIHYFHHHLRGASASILRFVYATGAALTVVTLITSGTQFFTLADGRADVIGWDELRPVSEWVVANTRDDASVLVFPTYDTNGSIYPQSDRLPPFYMKTWIHHASIPENAALLTEKTIASPPDVIVFFRDHFVPIAQYFPELETFMDDNYVEVARLENIPLQGDVIFLERRLP